MPKSRRERKTALTQVKKHGKDTKGKLIEDIRSCTEQYKYVYLFETENMRNSKFKDIREEWGGSRFFLGKNKVMSLALGKTPEAETKKNLFKLSLKISGNCGLLFTDSARDHVVNWFNDFSEENFARAGFECTTQFDLAAGPLPIDVCPHPMEPMLRKLGLPTRLNQGVVELLNDVTVCKEGDILTPEQCRILQIFDVKLATFKIHILGVYDLKKEDYTTIKEAMFASEADDADEMEDDNKNQNDDLFA